MNVNNVIVTRTTVKSAELQSHSPEKHVRPQPREKLIHQLLHLGWSANRTLANEERLPGSIRILVEPGKIGETARLDTYVISPWLCMFS